MNLPFSIQLQDGVPVSDQIVQAVRKAVFGGQLCNAQPFPSVRALSQVLRISPTTAHKVVAQLKGEGLLASRPGIGMVVTAANLPPREDRLRQLAPSCHRLLENAEQLNLSVADALEALRHSAAQREESS
jgi:DNA-binding transcriptional regulator YhcF (GntR family)